MNRIPPVMFFMTFAKRNFLCIQCNAIRAGKTYQESVEVRREQKFAQAQERRRRFEIIRKSWIHPGIDKLLEHVERQRAVCQHNVMELPQIELRAELLLRFLAQIEDPQHPDFVSCRLARHDDVTID